VLFCLTTVVVVFVTITNSGPVCCFFLPFFVWFFFFFFPKYNTLFYSTYHCVCFGQVSCWFLGFWFWLFPTDIFLQFSFYITCDESIHRYFYKKHQQIKYKKHQQKLVLGVASTWSGCSEKCRSRSGRAPSFSERFRKRRNKLLLPGYSARKCHFVHL